MSEERETNEFVGGYDVGGTKVAILIANAATGEIVASNRYASGEFPSLEALFDQSLEDAGPYRPKRVVMAIAGPRQVNGDIQITNQNWPAFAPATTTEMTGVEVLTINDLAAAAAGLGDIVIDEQLALNSAPEQNGSRLVIAISTGIGDALRLPNGGQIVPGEAGHTTWQPADDWEVAYLQYLQKNSRTSTITVEQAIGGKYGMGNLCDFVAIHVAPDPRLKDQVRWARQFHRPVGPLLTSGALDGDRHCTEALKLLGSILGQHIRNRAVATMPSGGIFLTGGIIQTPGLAQWLVNRSLFSERYVSRGAQHDTVLRNTPLYVVRNENIAVEGALAIARS